MKNEIKDEGKVILMKVDFAFKYVMRNEKVVKGFLAAVLGIDKNEIEKIEYLDTNTEKDSEDGKLGIMDLLVSMNGNARINIEIQLTLLNYWSNRLLFYLSEEYISGYRSGMNYDDESVPRAISISILDCNYLKDENTVYNNYKLVNTKSGNILTDKVDIHIIELGKLKNVTHEEENEHPDIIKWARFISSRTWSEYEKYGKGDEAMEEAVKELKRINADQIEHLRYLHREIAMRDENQRKADEEKAIREKQEAEEAKKKAIDAKEKAIEETRKAEEAKRKAIEAKDKAIEETRKAEEEREKAEEEREKAEEEREKAEEEREKAEEEKREWEQKYEELKRLYDEMQSNK